MNSVMAIHPYKANGLWIFDDLRVGLRQEPFVAGADTIIEKLVKRFLTPRRALPYCSPAKRFLGIKLLREELGGNWYYCCALAMEGWLCPALFKYFDSAPKKIYAQFRPGASDRPTAAHAPKTARQ